MDSYLPELLFQVLLVIPAWIICRRAGFHPALSLLIFIPVIGFLIVLGILANSKWPAFEKQGG